MNRDGRISPLDAALIFQLDAGILATFPTAGAKPVPMAARIMTMAGPRSAGGHLIVPVMLSERAEVVAGELLLTYDPAVVEVIEVRPADAVSGWSVASHAQGGQIRVAFAGAEAGMGAGDLLQVELRPLQNLNATGYPLVLTRVVLNDGAIPVTVPPPLPTWYVLAQNTPNPCNPETQIRFELPKAGPVTMVVYDLTGQVVRVLVEGERGAGRYTVTWDGTDGRGRAVASGVYVYRLTAGEFTAVKKMVVVR